MSQQRVFTLSLLAGLFVSLGTASAAESLNATVINASGEVVIINVGSANGIAAGSRFRIFSISKMVRIPLTGTVVMSEGEPVGVIRVVAVAESTARCKVEVIEPNKQIKPGHSAVYISRPTRVPTGEASSTGASELDDGNLQDSSDFTTGTQGGGRNTPTPDGYLPPPDIIRIGLKAEPSMPTPGKVVKITLRGLDRAAPGYSIFWSCSAGSFAMPLSSKTTNEWTAPRMAGRYQLTAEVRLADGKISEGRGVIEVTGTAALKDSYKIERIIGYKVVENKTTLNPRDLAVDELGNCFYIDGAQRCVFMLGRSGTFGSAANRVECEQAGVKDPIAIAARAGRIYLLDRKAPHVKVFTTKGFERSLGGPEIKYPTDIAVDGRGRVFIVDRSSRSFHVYNSAGTYLRSRGSRGRGIGRFDTPTAIDIAANGNILVLDIRARKVQIFDPDLSAISQIALRATRNLLDIATAPKGDRFYVLEGPKGGIVGTYSTSGNGVTISYPVKDKKKFTNLPPKVLRIATDDIGRIQVIGHGLGVVRYTEDGFPAGRFATDKPGDVHKIAVGEDGYFAVLDDDAPYLRLYDPGGWRINRFGSKSDKPFGLTFPSRITISRSGGAVATLGRFSRSPFSRSSTDPVLNLFDSKGNYSRRLCRYGKNPGELIDPLDIATDREGFVYTLDRNNIQKFSSTGTNTTPERFMQIDIGSRNPHEMHRPYRFTIDPDTREFYIYDYKRKIIKKFASDLSYIGETGSEITFSRVERMVTGHMGGLWVFDSKLKKIMRLDFRKTLAQSPFEFDPGKIQGAIVDFGVDGNGRLYVLTNHDIIYVYR